MLWRAEEETECCPSWLLKPWGVFLIARKGRRRSRSQLGNIWRAAGLAGWASAAGCQPARFFMAVSRSATAESERPLPIGGTELWCAQLVSFLLLSVSIRLMFHLGNLCLLTYSPSLLRSWNTLKGIHESYTTPQTFSTLVPPLLSEAELGERKQGWKQLDKIVALFIKKLSLLIGLEKQLNSVGKKGFLTYHLYWGYNLQTRTFAHLKCTVWWLSLNLYSYATFIIISPTTFHLLK